MNTYVPATVSRYAPIKDNGLMYLLSDEYRRLMWRSVWCALASAQSPDLVPEDALKAIITNSTELDVDASLREEKSTKHDLVAELNVYRRQCGEYGKYLHLGATSSDITENAHILVLAQATKAVLNNLSRVWFKLSQIYTKETDTLRLGRTHLQPANATTYGCLFGFYSNEVSSINHSIEKAVSNMTLKGFKGSVGNRMAYAAAYWLRHPNWDWQDAHKAARNMDSKACYNLGYIGHTFALQTPSRHQEYILMASLCSSAACLSKIATDIRLLCSTGHLIQRRSPKHVGSSAMPWKNNPIEMEKVCSLARMMPGYLGVIWDNAANNWLERSLDDSANARIIWPEALLTMNHIAETMTHTISDLCVSEEMVYHDTENILGDSLAMLPVEIRRRNHDISDREIETMSAKAAFISTKI